MVLTVQPRSPAVFVCIAQTYLSSIVQVVVVLFWVLLSLPNESLHQRGNSARPRSLLVVFGSSLLETILWMRKHRWIVQINQSNLVRIVSCSYLEEVQECFQRAYRIVCCSDDNEFWS